MPDQKPLRDEIAQGVAWLRGLVVTDMLTTVLTEHRADGWACTCGWPLNDSVGSVVGHLAAQIRPLMRCPVTDPTGLPCRLFPGHSGEHGDGRGVVWSDNSSSPERSGS